MADVDDLDRTLSEILGKMSSLPLVGQALTVLQELHSAISPLITSITAFLAGSSATAAATVAGGAATGGNGPRGGGNNTTLIAAIDRNTAALNRLSSLLEQIITAVRNRVGGNPSSVPALPPPGGGGGGGPGLPPGSTPPALPPGPGGTPPIPSGGGAGAGAAGAAAGLGSVAAIGAICAAALGLLVIAISAAERMFNKIKEWVNLFNPGVIQIFQMALDNMGATLGRAFVPIFTTMTEVIRQFTSMLAPIMANLLPIIQEFSNLMGGILMTYVSNFTSLLRGLLPVLDSVMTVWKTIGEMFLMAQGWIVLVIRALSLFYRIVMELTPLGIAVKVLSKAFEAFNVVMRIAHEAMDILQIVITTIVDAIVEFVASFIPIEKIMNSLREAIQFVVRNMYVLAVQFAKMVGLQSVADNLIKHIEGKLKAGDTAAQTPQIKGIEQLSRDLALAAASAGGAAGGNRVRDERDFWKKTLEEMKTARDNGTSIRDMIKDIRDFLVRLAPHIVRGAMAATPSGNQVGGGGIPNPTPASTPVSRDSRGRGIANIF